MPLGAVVAIASTVASHISFKASSASVAGAVMPAVVQSALSGNLTAFRVLDERRNIGVTSERNVWQSGYQQVVTTRPDILTQYNANKAQVPVVDETDTQRSAAFALAHPFSAPGQGTPASSQSPALDTLARATTATGLPWYMLALLVGGGAWLVYKLVKKG